MALHVKITDAMTDDIPGKVFIDSTLLDRDLVLSLHKGDVLFHGGFKFRIHSKTFITSGAGNLAAELIVTNETA